MTTAPGEAAEPMLSVVVLPGPEDHTLRRTLDAVRGLDGHPELLVPASSVGDTIRRTAAPYLVIVRPGDVLVPAGVAAAIEALATHPDTVAHIGRAVAEPPCAGPPAVGLGDATIADPAWASTLVAGPTLLDGRILARSLLSCGLDLLGPSGALTIRNSTLSPDDVDEAMAGGDGWTMRLALHLLLRGPVSYDPSPTLSVPAPTAADILAEHEARPRLIELAHRLGHLGREDELVDAILAHQDAASAFVRQVVAQGQSAPAERVRGLLSGAAALWERLESARLPVEVRVRPGVGEVERSLRSGRLLTERVSVAGDAAFEVGPADRAFPVLIVEAGEELEVLDRDDLAAGRLRGVRTIRHGVADDWMARMPMGTEATSSPVRFAFVAPDYSPLSGGIIALHRLCDRLNMLGHDAAIWSMNTGVTNPQWNTPVLTSPEELADRVLVYPEIISGNPLGAKRVVRWLLNRPGHLTDGGSLDASGDDLLVAWNRAISPDLPVLEVPVVDPSVFYPKSGPGSGALLWVGKGSLPAGFDRSSTTLITRSWPATKAQLAAQLRSTSVLYSADWLTAMVFESLLCATPVVLVGDGGPWDRTEMADTLDVRGAGWPGDDIEALRRGAAGRHEAYLRDVARCDSDVSAFVDLVRDHFGSA